MTTFFEDPTKSEIFAGTSGDRLSWANATQGVSIDLVRGKAWDGQHQDAFSGYSVYIGSAFNDVIFGNGGDNIIDGGAGGIDALYGGAGSDTVSYETSASGVKIDLSAQNSWDGTSMDVFTSIENATGSAFADVIIGSAGDNVFNGGAGSDYILGDAGNDTLSYVGAANAVYIDLAAGTAWNGSEMDGFSSIENAIGTSGNDTIVGTSGDNVIDGGSGGSDYVDGGGGIDTLSYASSLSGISIVLASGVSWDGSAMDGFTSIEKIVGSAYNDVIVGDGNDNILDPGSGGIDYVDGGGGNDTVSFVTTPVGTGVTINLAGHYVTHPSMGKLVSVENAIGSVNVDLLYGSGQGGHLNGWSGNDLLFGATGPDVFEFKNSDGSAIGSDIVFNFNPAEDVLAIDQNSDIHSYADVASHLTQAGADVQIAISAALNEIITLRNTLASSLTSSDFAFI